MTAALRTTGIDVVGNVPWGTHCCLFYETTTQLLDTLAAYCEAGLARHQCCLWVIAPPVRS